MIIHCKNILHTLTIFLIMCYFYVALILVIETNGILQLKYKKMSKINIRI